MKLRELKMVMYKTALRIKILDKAALLLLRSKSSNELNKQL